MVVRPNHRPSVDRRDNRSGRTSIAGPRSIVSLPPSERSIVRYRTPTRRCVFTAIARRRARFFSELRPHNVLSSRNPRVFVRTDVSRHRYVSFASVAAANAGPDAYGSVVPDVRASRSFLGKDNKKRVTLTDVARLFWRFYNRTHLCRSLSRYLSSVSENACPALFIMIECDTSICAHMYTCTRINEFKL